MSNEICLKLPKHLQKKSLHGTNQSVVEAISFKGIGAKLSHFPCMC